MMGPDRMGYSRMGDVVTLTMSIDDWEMLIHSLGVSAGQASRDRKTLKAHLALANRLNVGNPNWTPYAGVETNADSD